MTASAGKTIHSLKPPVSFHDEQLMLVDCDDVVVGHADKLDAHQGAGRLHRAFSVFLFDDNQRLLVHRRASKKPLWPGFWTNSCCSHPRRGETLDQAVHRRIYEELGVNAAATSVYSFEYRAQYLDLGTEHELCHVFLARAPAGFALNVHEDEIAEVKWLTVNEVDELANDQSSDTTPWFKLEWQALRNTHAQTLDRYLATPDTTRIVA